MERTTVVLLSLLVVATGVVGWLGYWTLQDLNAEIAGLRTSVADLRGELTEAERRATAARDRAEAAEGRAEQAEDLSARLAERAREAEDEARAAMGEAELARSEAAQTAEARRLAEERSEAALLEAARAEQEAEATRRRLAQVQEQRERDLDRLQRTLGDIAETRRTALGLVMNLGDAIEFDFDKARLRAENRELLSRIAGVLLTAEDFGIQVYGHTDDVGSADYNLELSERRAKAVREYLLEAGLDPDQIVSKGFGKSVPLVEGTDPASRQRNRRVEIAVVQVSGDLPADFVAEDLEGPERDPSADGR